MLFGYGSLIWRPDFPFLHREPAVISGYARRFWQGSHDHRGTPDAPGRVVTLIDAPGMLCRGMLYEVDAAVAASVLRGLDHRESNGYERLELTAETDRGTPRRVVVYRAAPGNKAWLGAAPADQIAEQIARSCGPSGHNRDYLFELAEALRSLGDADVHVADLEQRVRALAEQEQPS